MMATLLILRGRIRHYFEKHYTIIRGILKGLVVLVVLMLLTGKFPDGFFSNYRWVFPVVAVACGFLPDAIGILSIVAIVGIEVWQISAVQAVTLLMMIAIFFLLFGRKAKDQWYMLISVPTLSALQMGFSVPVVSALFAGPSLIPALVMGLVVRFSLDAVSEYTATAQRIAGDSNMFAPLQYLINYIISNRLLWVALLVYIITFTVVYLLRRANFKYSPQIAILVGTVVLYTLEMVSNIIWELELNLILTSVLVLVTMGIAYLFQFMHISLDYHGIRKLQFEDDEYYYYVSAVPKYNVAVGDKIVTKILPEDVAEVTAELREEVEKALAEERGIKIEDKKEEKKKVEEKKPEEKKPEKKPEEKKPEEKKPEEKKPEKKPEEKKPEEKNPEEKKEEEKAEEKETEDKKIDEKADEKREEKPEEVKEETKTEIEETSESTESSEKTENEEKPQVPRNKSRKKNRGRKR